MSYILEALKKAQAERQLGNAPTIHAPPPTYAPTPGARSAGRRYLAIGLGAGVLAAALALLWMRHAAEQPLQVAAAPAASAPVSTPAAAPAPAPAVAAVYAPAAPASAPAPAPAPATAPATASAPAPALGAAPAPAPTRALTPVPVPAARAPAAPSTPAPAPAGVREAAPSPGPAVQPAPPADPAVPVPAAAPAADENLRSLQQLPEALQREIPRVTFGGYIYSPTPGESLLLVDKTLRREGEEVAPGLVLERLTAKAAVMNYRGTRYRVGY